MADLHRDGATCTGEHCDICDEMHCSDRLVVRDGIRLCPVCRYILDGPA